MTNETDYFDRIDRERISITALAVMASIGLIMIVIGATIHYGVAGFFASVGMALFIVAVFAALLLSWR